MLLTPNQPAPTTHNAIVPDQLQQLQTQFAPTHAHANHMSNQALRNRTFTQDCEFLRLVNWDKPPIFDKYPDDVIKKELVDPFWDGFLANFAKRIPLFTLFLDVLQNRGVVTTSYHRTWVYDSWKETNFSTQWCYENYIQKITKEEEEEEEEEEEKATMGLKNPNYEGNMYMKNETLIAKIDRRIQRSD
ncbi:hypothetical protein GIB67_000747 [Kingdonia uniflora]|uniref:Uncharacterized protein n=1 Tax=Kingdonia uniflora TaxID=39325 RepID=A0A7J7NDK2_9MAGN|nr:hypothetical protein GIB67_000747 [Kingdonia uniflora]